MGESESEERAEAAGRKLRASRETPRMMMMSSEVSRVQYYYGREENRTGNERTEDGRRGEQHYSSTARALLSAAMAAAHSLAFPFRRPKRGMK